jgi:hypothetical protein
MAAAMRKRGLAGVGGDLIPGTCAVAVPGSELRTRAGPTMQAGADQEAGLRITL